MTSTEMTLDEFRETYDDMRVEGAKLHGEEVYTHQTQGSYNMTRINSLIEDAKRSRNPLKTTPIEVTENIIRVNEIADVSPSRVLSMPSHLPYVKPIIFIEIVDGSYICADGNHRLRRAIIDGAEVVPAYLIPYHVAQQFRVRTQFHRRDTDTWEEVPDEFLLAMSKGHFEHHAYY